MLSLASKHFLAFRSTALEYRSVIPTAINSWSPLLSAFSPFSTQSGGSEAFKKAQQALKRLPSEPEVDVKLKIYALYKQVTDWDISLF